MLSRRCLRKEKETSVEKFFFTKDSEVVLHSPEASLLIAPARDSCFVKELAVACQPAKLSTSPPSRELGDVEPGEAPAKPLRPTPQRLDQLELKLGQLSSVWCAKTGTALNDERDSGSFESPPRREMRMKAQGGRAGNQKCYFAP